MYVKVIRHVDGKGVSNRHGDPNETTVPTEDHIWETEHARYRKVVAETFGEFEENMYRLGSHYMAGRLPEIPDWPERGIEYFVIRLSNGEVLVAPNCSLYIMSNEGKTLDGVHCS